MPPPPRATLVLFARDPRRGPVKTRLAASIGTDAAKSVYQDMLQATLARATAWPFARRVIALTPDDGAATFDLGNPSWDGVIAQGSGTLGERLWRAFQALSNHQEAPVVFIGADSPDLPHDRIAAASSIAADEAYFVPALDGGYCLLSVCCARPELFEPVDRGGGQVLNQSLAAAERCGLRPVLGPSWRDVDTAADLAALRERLIGSAEPALAQLRDALRRIKLGDEQTSSGGNAMSNMTAKQAATVLIADDNPQIVELLEAYLESLPIRTVSAADGEAALRAVAAEKPDLLLLDIMMPRCSGFDVCKRLKADPLHKDLPIIVITALNEVTDEERARDSGADVFISKPVNKLELLNHIRRLLAAKLPAA